MNILNKYSPDSSDIHKRIKNLNDVKINVINSKISSGEYDNQILDIISNHTYVSLLLMIDLKSFTINIKNFDLTKQILDNSKQYFLNYYDQKYYDVIVMEDSHNDTLSYKACLINKNKDSTCNIINIFDYDEYYDQYYINHLYKDIIINRFRYVFENKVKEISNILEMRYNMIINKDNEDDLKY